MNPVHTLPFLEDPFLFYPPTFLQALIKTLYSPSHTQNKIILISITVNIKYKRVASNCPNTVTSHLDCIPISQAPIQLHCAPGLN
jgi:hypothetical protein